MDTSRYTYEVHPRIPIKNVIPKKGIFRVTTLELTKEEVRECLKCGPVFRKFDRNTLIQVTLYTLDELHVAKYTPKKDNVETDPAKKTTVYGTIVPPKTPFIPRTISPAKKEEVAADEPTKEEVKADEPTKEEVPLEEAPEVEVKADEPTKVEEPVEEVIAAESVEEAVPEAPVEEDVETVEEPESIEEPETVEDTVEESEEPVEEVSDEEAPVAGQANNNQQNYKRNKKKHH